MERKQILEAYVKKKIESPSNSPRAVTTNTFLQSIPEPRNSHVSTSGVW
jgi:hypothetical protein